MAEEEIQRVDLESQDLVAERIEQLKALFPEVATEGDGSIDFEKLRLILGEEINTGDERYAFTWPGKTDAIRQSQTVSTATLRPCVEKSRGRDGRDGSFDSDNIYIEGDNLEVLKLLQRSYHGKVKMIYIDPPYNTGHDFVYKDKFGDTIANYKEQTGLTSQSNPDTSGRYHSDWCSMMYPRLKLARELLREDGVIFISIDDQEEDNLKKICDEVFGSTNCVAILIWEKKYTRANDSIFFSSNHDFIFCYAKNVDRIKITRLPRSEEMNSAYKNPDNDYRGPWKSTPLHARSGSINSLFEFTFSNGVKWMPPAGTYSRYSREVLSELDASGEIWFGKNGDAVPSRKTYLSKVMDNGIVPCTIIPFGLGGHNHMAVEEVKSLFNGSNVFTSPKPVKLLKLLMHFADVNSSDVVFDFFSGSATTAEAVLQMSIEEESPRFMLVQLPEKLENIADAYKNGFYNLCQLGEERIRRAGDKIKAELQESNQQLTLGEEPKPLPDIGFRVFTLDDSGIRKPEPGELAVDRVKPERSDLDIIFEMMLKWGLELTYPVEKRQMGDYQYYSVNDNALVCCLQKGLTVQNLQEIADLQPQPLRVFILDSVLDDTLKLNAIQIFKHKEELTQQPIDLRTV